MQIERLEYFLEVIKKGSMNLASESLHISQQALSQSMQALEKELGVALFERSNKGISITENGVRLYVVASEIIEKWNELLMSFASIKPLEGEIRIGYVLYAEVDYYSIVQPYMREKYPNIKIVTLMASNQELFQLLNDNKLDFVIVNFQNMDVAQEALANMSVLEGRVLQSDNISLLASKSSPLKYSSGISFKDLRKYTIAMSEIDVKDDDNFILKMLQKNNCDNILFFNSEMARLKVVERGDAVTFVSGNSIIPMEYNESFCRIPIKENVKMVRYVIYHKDRIKKDMVLHEVIEALCKQFE